MGIKRKQHSAEFKARVAMTALSGEKTLAELSAEFGVHPTMISGWKQERFLTNWREPATGMCRNPARMSAPWLARPSTDPRA